MQKHILWQYIVILFCCKSHYFGIKLIISNWSFMVYLWDSNGFCIFSYNSFIENEGEIKLWIKKSRRFF